MTNDSIDEACFMTRDKNNAQNTDWLVRLENDFIANTLQATRDQ